MSEEPTVTTETAPAPAGAVENDARELDTSTTEPGPEDGQAGDDTDEIDYEGARYRVPKVLKDAFLRHSDYSKKTADVAETRKAIEAEKAEIEATRKNLAHRTEAKDVLGAIGLHIKNLERQMSGEAWERMRAEDPLRANNLFQDWTRLKHDRDVLAGRIKQDEDAEAQKAESERNNRRTAGHAELARAIPNWSPETAEKIASGIAREYGFTREFLANAAVMDNPAIVKAMNDALNWRQHVAKQRAQAQNPPEVPAKPLPRVGSSRAPAINGLSDSMPTEQWMKSRDKQAAGRA